MAALLDADPQSIQQVIAASGLSPDEIRARLTASGLSASVLDGFLSGAIDAGVPVDEGVVDALAALNLVDTTADGLATLSLQSGMMVPEEDSLPPPSDVFGVDVFRRATSRFQPLLTGPVPDDYQLGPGDRLVIVLTGEVQVAHEVQVNRAGFIVVPEAGRIPVANQPMRSVRGLVRSRLSESYSGVARGTTAVDVTISELGVNQIYVTGEVAQPGAYQLSSVATATNALYAAGGPTEAGSLRDVRVRRRGGEEVTLDLYPYLIQGKIDQDVPLRQGDVVFVPLHGRRVRISGAVNRPAAYELSAGEDLLDALKASGGFQASARRDRLTIHRVLPTADHRGGAPRVAISLDLPSAADTDPSGLGNVGIPTIGLLDGDSIVVDHVPSVDDGLFVTIGGHVEDPGRFPWQPGMTVLDLIRLANGPTVGADLRAAEVARLPADRADGALATLHRVPLDRRALQTNELLSGGGGGGGMAPGMPTDATAPDFFLDPFDDVRILRMPDFEMQRTVVVAGEVPVPGRYTLESKNDRVTDVLARAGGLLPTAYAPGARLIRNQGNLGSINLDLASALENPTRDDNLTLEPGDSLFVPVYSPTVTVRGAVNSPVTVLFEEGRDVGYYLENAGGFRHDADTDRLSVRYANGQAETRSKFLFFSSDPQPRPGSTINVPTEDPADRVDVRGLVRDMVAIVGSITTLVIVANR